MFNAKSKVCNISLKSNDRSSALNNSKNNYHLNVSFKEDYESLKIANSQEFDELEYKTENDFEENIHKDGKILL